MNRDLLEPRVFLVAYLGFFILASRVLSLQSALVVLAGAFAFIAGRYLSGFFELKKPRLRVGFPVLEVLFLISVLGILLDLMHIGGTPLFDSSLHSKHLTLYLLLGFPIVPLSALLVSRYLKNKRNGPASIIILVTLLLTCLLGYRTDIAASILSFGGVYFLFKRISGKQLLLLVFLCISLVITIGFMKSSAIGSTAGSLEVFSGRVEGTASLFDHIVLHSSPFGSLKGQLHNSALSSLTYQLIPGPVKGPRTLIAEFFGARENVTFTATLLGPLYLDLGVFGVLLGLVLLGFMLSLLFSGRDNWQNKGLYAVLLSFSLISIETGILDIVLFYFIGAAIYLLSCARRV